MTFSMSVLYALVLGVQQADWLVVLYIALSRIENLVGLHQREVCVQ